MRVRRAGEEGSILLDYFIGVSFFLVTLGAFVQMTSAKVRATGEAERLFRAVAAAESRLAEARAGAAEPGTFAVPALAGGRGELVVAPREDGLRAATVVVRWHETGGKEESVRLATVLGAKP
jgi:hypothetical protein